MRLRCDATKLKEEFVLSQQYRDNLPDLKSYGISPHHAMFMFAVEFNLYPYDLEVYAKKPKEKRRSIKQLTANLREDAQPYFEFEGSERINFRDKADDLQFFFDVDYAYSRADSANRQKVERVFYSKNGKNYLLVGVPWNWLQNAPVGEVVIDPTIHAGSVQDTWLEDSYNNGSDHKLLVGKSAGQAKKRSLIKFDLSGIPAGVELHSADMRLHYYNGSGNSGAWIDRPVGAHRVLSQWEELRATTTSRMVDTTGANIYFDWNAPYGQSGSDYSAIAEDTEYITPDYPRWVSWNIKDLAQTWIDGVAENYGVMLLATNEDTDGWDVRFRSSDYATQNATDIQFRPKLEIRWTLATRTTYFLKDHLGTTRAAINDAGDVVGYDDYDPWGLILANRSMTTQPDMPFKYTGKEWDDDNGLNWYYFGARYYDPVVGRWNGVDPLAEKYINVSPYVYSNNSPVFLVDVNGEFWVASSYKSFAVYRHFVGTTSAFAAVGLVPMATGILNSIRAGFFQEDLSAGEIGLGFVNFLSSWRKMGQAGYNYMKYGDVMSNLEALRMAGSIAGKTAKFSFFLGDRIAGDDDISQSQRDAYSFALAEQLGWGKQEFGKMFGVFRLSNSFKGRHKTKVAVKAQFGMLDDFFKIGKEQFIKKHGKGKYSEFLKAAQKSEAYGDRWNSTYDVENQ